MPRKAIISLALLFCAALLWFSLQDRSGSPIAAAAKAGPACAIPASLPRPQAEQVDAAEANPVPVTGYTLALSWSPQFCRNRKDDPDQATQCGPGKNFGFILHGLWPEGQGRDAPAYCNPAEVLTDKQVRQALLHDALPQSAAA